MAASLLSGRSINAVPLSFSEAIEKVEIVQMDNSVMATHNMERNVLDITVTCQGRYMHYTLSNTTLQSISLFVPTLTGACSSSSLPKEVCSVILDADCLKPIHTECNMVEPSKECQLVLRHFFNDSGVYCINVSMANDVSLAVTSAKVKIDIGTLKNILQSNNSERYFFIFHTNHVILVSASGLSSPGTIAMVLGFLVLVVALGIVAFSYK